MVTELVLSVTREGKPIIPTIQYLLIHTFANGICATCRSKATGNKEYAEIAKKTFDLILQKKDNPKDIGKIIS